MTRKRILITVKTYPIPSAKYDELVCTAGITEAGEFIRIYPINFRDLPFSQQYKKYEWIEIDVEKHTGRDARKESYRPKADSIHKTGESIKTRGGDWSERAKHVLPLESKSMEDLYDQQARDNTSLGFMNPRTIDDLKIEKDDPDWSPKFLAELSQARLWETRKVTKQPPRKVPFKFRYHFTCDDPRCTGHKMMIEDWEVGALYWNLVDKGATPDEAAQGVKKKFLYELCGEVYDRRFFVGTVLAHGTWVIIGLWRPKKPKDAGRPVLPLFDQT